MKKKRRFNKVNLLFKRKKKEVFCIKRKSPYNQVVVLNKQNKVKPISDDKHIEIIDRYNLQKDKDINNLRLSTFLFDNNLINSYLKIYDDDLNKKILMVKDTINNISIKNYDDDVLPMLYEIILDKDLNNKKETKEDIEKVKDYAGILTQNEDVSICLEKIENDINEKMENADIDYVLLEKMKDEAFDKDKLNSYIKKFLDEQSKNIDKLIYKVDYDSKKVQKKTILVREHLTNMNKVLLGTSLIATTPLIPPTRGGKILRLGLIIFGINNLACATRVNKRPVDKTITFYENYESIIKKGLTDLNSISLNIDNALYDIRMLKEDFKKYMHYKEYDVLIKNLDDIEYSINIQREVLIEYNDKLNKALTKNNLKIKKMDVEIEKY